MPLLDFFKKKKKKPQPDKRAAAQAAKKNLKKLKPGGMLGKTTSAIRSRRQRMADIEKELGW